MNRKTKSSADPVLRSLLIRGGLALFVLLAWFMLTAKAQSQTESPLVSTPIHVTHLPGFEDVRRNVSGELSIQDGDLRFRRDSGSAAQLSITSIQNISLGEQDKQIGGVPLMMGKAAVP
jgi:hypothetical protein